MVIPRLTVRFFFLFWSSLLLHPPSPPPPPPLSFEIKNRNNKQFRNKPIHADAEPDICVYSGEVYVERPGWYSIMSVLYVLLEEKTK